ncbi:MAG TPA: hypothetical protein VK563_11935 [Puia sp.]|nr:hypothetical protein [Puia sp.]
MNTAVVRTRSGAAYGIKGTGWNVNVEYITRDEHPILFSPARIITG